MSLSELSELKQQIEIKIKDIDRLTPEIVWLLEDVTLQIRIIINHQKGNT